MWMESHHKVYQWKCTNMTQPHTHAHTSFPTTHAKKEFKNLNVCAHLHVVVLLKGEALFLCVMIGRRLVRPPKPMRLRVEKHHLHLRVLLQAGLCHPVGFASLCSPLRSVSDVPPPSAEGGAHAKPPPSNRKLLLDDAAHQEPPGVLSTLWTELKKVVPLVRFQAAALGRVMTGTDGPSPELIEREQKHKEVLRAEMAKQQQRARAAYRAHLASLPSWKERLLAQLNDAKESLKATTSKKSGVAALIQHCAASHAAEVAAEQDIDVRDVQIVLEKQNSTAKSVSETKVVGYIDAPAASEEEVAVFAQRLSKACPAAAAYDGHIEWRKRGGRGSYGAQNDDMGAAVDAARGDWGSSVSAGGVAPPSEPPQDELNVNDAVGQPQERYKPRTSSEGTSTVGNASVKKKPFQGFRL